MKTSWAACAVFLAVIMLSATTLQAAETSTAAGDAAFSLADGGGGDVPLVAAPVRQLMQDRNYAEARKAIDAAARAADAPRDYLAYLRAWSFCLEKQYDAAAAACAQWEKDFPHSPWLRRVRLARAAALAKKGDFAKAAEIYRDETTYLLSPARRAQLAAIYLEFADAFFHPAKEDQKPNYAEALMFYNKALEIGPQAARRENVELSAAQCIQKVGQYSSAAAAYEAFSKAHPASPLDVEARYCLGECRLAEGKRAAARRVWTELLGKYAEGQSPRVADAALQVARTWHAPRPASQHELREAVAALEAFLTRFPTHAAAPQARLDIAQSYLFRERYAEAAAALNRFIKDERYKDRKEVAGAWDLLGQCYARQKKFAEALAAWHECLVRYPAQENWSSVQNEIIDTEYGVGLEKYKLKQYDAAAKLLAEFMTRYPLDGRGPGILFLFGQMSFEQQRWEAALSDWRRLVSKYPRTREAARAQFMLARTLERQLGKPQEALREYRKVSAHGGSEGQPAVARLLARTMQLSTERIFRSSETPRVKLVTRNVPSVTVRAYKLDLETYFRKMHTVGGIEKLDVALIDPDKTFEFTVPGYSKCALIESAIEVPLPAAATAGVMVVTVSSPTLEATTLVIQSDLELIVQASHDEVFVFAENMNSGQPWPAARVLVSNGTQVISEAATGAGGVWQRACKELRAAGEVRIFAAAGAHVAASTVQLHGASVGVVPAEGEVSAGGYLATDRPVYQPGQTVHVRACVRQARAQSGGHWSYGIEKDKKYVLEVRGDGERLLRQKEVLLSAAGSFQDEFVLPLPSPQGRYTISAHDEAGYSYQCVFRVERSSQERVGLTIDCPRTVYYRGDVIEGTIRARFYHGAPLIGQTIHYRWGGEAPMAATTDDRGEVHFRLPTSDFGEPQNLTLVATTDQYTARAVANLTLATEGFSIAVRSARPVLLAGEACEVTVETRDAEGRPLAEKLALKLCELVSAHGTLDRRVIADQPCDTAADGLAHTTLKVEKGGRYLVVVEGVDRFQNAITGQLELRVSDEDDPQRLLILADRSTFKVGDQAEVQVQWREAPALALLSCRGTRVLQHQVAALRRGTNRLVFPVTSTLAPRFELSVAAMTALPAAGSVGGSPSRYHEAAAQFAVQQDLQLKIDCAHKGGAAGAMRPGETVEVTVTASDPQGRPVVAESSLAMLPESLAAKGEGVSPIQDSFDAVAQSPTVRSGSSSTFAYRPTTRAIDPQLLSERQRAQMAAEEAASRAEGLIEEHAGAGGGPAGVEEPGEMGALAGPARPLPLRAQEHASDFDSLLELIAATLKPSDFARPAAPGAHETPLAASPQNNLARSGKPRSFAGQAAGGGNAAPAETHYWNGAIVTGTNGRATVEITLPQRPGNWVLEAKGLTADALAGEATLPLALTKDLAAEWRLPTAVTDGDDVEVPVVVRSQLDGDKPIDVTLRTTVAGRSVEVKKSIAAKGRGVYELQFKTAARLDAGAPPADEVLYEVTAVCGNERDELRRTLPLLPRGVSVGVETGGAASGNATAWIAPPQDAVWQSQSLKIAVDSSLVQTLASLGRSDGDAHGDGGAAPAVERASSDLLACCAYSRLHPAPADAADVSRRVAHALATLIVTQRSDGGWAWAGDGPSNRDASARAVWALSLARHAGYQLADAPLRKAVEYLRSDLAETDNGDTQSKALVLHALTVAGHSNFALANHLHRQRQELSPAGLAYLALALAGMDRPAMAGDVLATLATRDVDAATPGEAAHDPAAWSDSGVETRALWALAVLQVSPKAPQAHVLIDWLLAHRQGPGWLPEKAAGTAALALAGWLAENPFPAANYQLTVSINGTPYRTFGLGPVAASVVIQVPSGLLAKGKQRVDFQIAGQGRYSYRCTLGGVTTAVGLAGRSRWEVERTYQPPLWELDGHSLPRGFDVVAGPVATFQNAMTQWAAGRRAQVQLNLRLREPVAGGEVSSAAVNRHEYLVITEPLPAGGRVLGSSLHGPIDLAEMLPGAMRIYVDSRRPLGPISYELDGVLPGTYHVAPSVVRNAYATAPLAAAKAAALAVLPQGQSSSDPYRFTPRELYELGAALKEKGQLKAAAAHLGELVEKWTLGDDYYQRAIEMLLDIHLQLGPPSKVVRYFETVMEKWPDSDIPFANALKVGTAYYDIGEFERSYLAYRATMESCLTRESGVAGFLESRGEFLRSVDVMGRLLRDYPPEPYAAEAELALAQRIYAHATDTQQTGRGPSPEKVNRVDLIRRAWRMQEGFLTAHADDEAADQAGFAAVSALLELQDYRAAAAAATRYARYYPHSDLLDTYWYIVAYCEYATGQHEAALEMSRRVADAHKIDKETGREVESTNKWRAIYILGQIEQSMNRPADAIRDFRRVEDRFPEAKLSIAYFQRKAIELPEVTALRPGAAADVELKFRNVADCNVKVYRIDLMKFSRLAGNPGQITQINLSGICPLYDDMVPLGDGKDYRDRVHKLALPLTKEGAYMVVCRGEDLHASGLVLITPLAVEVQAEAASGQVRTTIKDATTDRYLGGAAVKVIGSRNSAFVSGTTDLRGVFVAEGIQGAATVIAQSETGRCAFFRAAPAAEAPPPGTPSVSPTPVGTVPAATDDPFAAPKPPVEARADAEEPFAPTAALAPATGPVAASPRHKRGVAPVTRTAEHHATAAVDMGGGGPAASRKKIDAALDSPTNFEFEETPLADVVAYLKDLHHIEIQLDRSGLDDAGVNDEAPVTKSLKGISLRSALGLLLPDLGPLTYVIKDEVLLITSKDKADTFLETVTYPVTDLTRVADAAPAAKPAPTADAASEAEQPEGEGSDFDSFIDVITSTVQPTTWDTVGGPGSIAPLMIGDKDVIVVSQTQEVHAEIAALLADLRAKGGKRAVDARAAKADGGDTVEPVAPRARRKRASSAGGFGGMGGGMAAGMGGGMGGMMGGMPSSGAGQANNGPNLLEGLQDANRAAQGQHQQRLNQRYQSGMGMGGGGGGVNAKGMF